MRDDALCLCGGRCDGVRGGSGVNIGGIAAAGGLSIASSGSNGIPCTNTRSFETQIRQSENHTPRLVGLVV